MSKLIEDIRFVVIDVETTGLSPKKDRICEISMVAVKNFEIVSEFSSLINPNVDIPAEAFNIHGIDNSMVERSPNFEDIADTIMDFISESVLVGHNIEFDFAFLSNEMRKIGYDIENFILIDTLTLSRKLYLIENYKLKTVADHLNINTDRYHRAQNDVEVTVKIFQNIIRTLKDEYKISTLDSLVNFLNY